MDEAPGKGWGIQSGRGHRTDRPICSATLSWSRVPGRMPSAWEPGHKLGRLWHLLPARFPILHIIGVHEASSPQWPWEGPGSLCPLRPPGCDYSGQSVPGPPPPMLVQAWHRQVLNLHAGLSRAVWHGPQVPRGTLQCMEMPHWVAPGDTAPPHRLFLVPCPPSSCSRVS